ncbi:hypothetical protein ERO13_D04G134600v2 [Gossypium hirsutum]|uniref:Gamma-interferon-responsive lysosomal thiol protein n=5 Tax=Gossypium TaxID=3633 RepID=A0A1U8IRW0_GOSHI|nr:gamma-interferon-responsive lysosomal thiol protein [Gossypium hirsutum]KAB2035484.1 hypothetical protein ES319_D04G155000v1 [Gossypium barbadense]TYG74217.1 hypothetical protein ES288_D04G164900v1 [Gossypium darwinii]TYH77626.1 hypothetical protein ES332_D04G166900v1 [Gossypium tomentosum]TYI87746.1 hypothetical protein E1A91_D04G157400v1 [Gossypium mustelinum]KAG4152634.1 hypothetical protein ERO13_D04G134600v2 [Gossypium hirsutum]
MGYLQQFIFFILVAQPFMFISLTHSSLANGKVNILPPTNTSDKVTLALYYETLCPYCADFITNDLVKVFLSDLFTIVNLKLVPWGNADILGDEPHCQHGEDECYLNTIHSCVIYHWPDVKKHFDFIRCTEQQSSKKPLVKNRAAMWKQCSEKLGMSAHRINKCYTSGYGLKLLLQYANETAKLKPPHEYVPWVVVDNQPLKDDFENFVKYVCEAYKGDNKPEACKTQVANVSSTHDKMANRIHPGCYASEIANLG